MMSFKFWNRWLVGVALFVVLFGILMNVLGSSSFFDVLFNRNIDPAFWGEERIPDAAREFQRWIYGAWGATVAGWGCTLAFLAVYAYPSRARWAWNAIATGVTLWFVLDTGISLYFRVLFNALWINTPLFLAALVALGFTRREFA